VDTRQIDSQKENSTYSLLLDVDHQRPTRQLSHSEERDILPCTKPLRGSSDLLGSIGGYERFEVIGEQALQVSWSAKWCIAQIA
jgi:hypothetical protein